ncbi:hypothetical protein TVAG_258270 [Trichomonas vaginalis G3]|uniref:Uncharacterized protein n=1 Tax=Trichomonas vaginalis (strain ATCC PRA-98 / G3) TaxID=412133 RepID=A2E931_TRIV3|nr:hypothetical protein TVAGG3_0542190 [Trichomonas vaginalis G3]EAY10825.1 hypothetical protein TVAG_258270 [Trichomonas vaginalis G3]KAI5519913.1 hypothetical protein TVAGG3_0542190 [Trichomonas vaginalis G3]|eukprot:XP_001323048.1 hypothetical protein [Trichomonas vaginalis G3]
MSSEFTFSIAGDRPQFDEGFTNDYLAMKSEKEPKYKQQRTPYSQSPKKYNKNDNFKVYRTTSGQINDNSTHKFDEYTNHKSQKPYNKSYYHNDNNGIARQHSTDFTPRLGKKSQPNPALKQPDPPIVPPRSTPENTNDGSAIRSFNPRPLNQQSEHAPQTQTEIPQTSPKREDTKQNKSQLEFPKESGQQYSPNKNFSPKPKALSTPKDKKLSKSNQTKSSTGALDNLFQ